VAYAGVQRVGDYDQMIKLDGLRGVGK